MILRDVSRRLHRVACITQRRSPVASFAADKSIMTFSSTTPTTAPTTAVEYDLPVLPDPPLPPEPSGIMRPKGFLTKMLTNLSIEHQQNRIYRGEELFQAATRQASDARWYGPGQIPRSFRSRHAMLTLHLWLLHKRLLADHLDRDAALQVDEELFNIFWDDTMCRIRQIPNVMELAVNKHLLAVQQYSFLHLTHYDHAYSSNFLTSPTERRKELRNLVWHHVWVRDPAVEKRYDLLDPLVWYIDVNVRNILLTWPDAYYREARVVWTDLPTFAAEGSIDVHPQDVVPAPWVRNITRRGVDYYWNPFTKETTWEKPGSGGELKES